MVSLWRWTRWAGCVGLVVTLAGPTRAATTMTDSPSEGQALGEFWRSYCAELRRRLATAGPPATLIAEPPPRPTAPARLEYWRLPLANHVLVIPAIDYDEILLSPRGAAAPSVTLRSNKPKREIVLQLRSADVLAVDDPEAWTRTQLQHFTDQMIDMTSPTILDMASLSVWLELAFRKTPQDLQCVAEQWEWDWKTALAVPLKRALAEATKYDQAFVLGSDIHPSWLLTGDADQAWLWILPSSRDPARYVHVTYSAVSTHDAIAAMAAASVVAPKPNAPPSKPAPLWVEAIGRYLSDPSLDNYDVLTARVARQSSALSNDR